MFVALYRWKIKSGCEEQFRAAWAKVTLALRENHESLGSRLHQAEDGTWTAYAQWPSKAAWEAPVKFTEDVETARQIMRESVEHRFPDFLMTVADDYLVSGK